MKLRARYVAWLLPFMLTGCIFHKTQLAQNQPLAPAIEDAPPPKPAPSPSDLPPPEVTVPAQAPAPDTTPAPPPKKAPQHRKPPATPAQQASVSPGVSAIGQLSTGDPPDLRQQTNAIIDSTERGLNSINRRLSDQEQKTADLIREDLKEARAALASGDVDGAHNLTVKAKVLLDELLR